MKYFQSVAQETGLNRLRENPCKLLGFELLRLGPGESFEDRSEEREIIGVILGGKCDVVIGERTFADLGGRPNVFAGKPYSFYVPRRTGFKIVAAGGRAVEIGLCSAPSELDTDPYVIAPDEVTNHTVGAANFTRTLSFIHMGEGKPIDRLMVAEAFVPTGNWATYPPHKHEVDNLPHEVFQEEMYFFRLNPPDGFGMARHYTDDGSINEAYVIKNNTIFIMPKGYHTVVAAPGYTMYYLACIAGNHRVSAPVLDPDVGWVDKTVPMLRHYLGQR